MTLLSKNTKYDKKADEWSIIDKEKHILSSIEGEFTHFLKFDNTAYWEYQKDAFPKFKRMAYTLASDSTFREDLNWLKKKDEDAAQRLKVKHEEIQRKDKKLRENWAKEQEKLKNKKK